MSGKKSLSNTKKILHKSGSNILPNIVTDYILQELENLEKITLFMYQKRHYDVLSDISIYQKERYMADPEEGKRSMISFPVTSTMIIQLRGTVPDEEEIYANGNTN